MLMFVVVVSLDLCSHGEARGSGHARLCVDGGVPTEDKRRLSRKGQGILQKAQVWSR